MALTLSQALIAKFGVDTSEFQAGMRRAQAQAETASQRLVSTFKRVSVAVAAIGTAAVGLGALFGKSIIEAASTSENLRLRLNALLGSVEQGARAFELMTDFAARVPFEFEEIMASATQLAGIVTGGADEIAGLMPIIADLAAVSGLSIDQTTQQIVRAFSAGIGSADLFRERGITAMLGFQAGATVSAEESRRRIVAAWEDVNSQFRGAADEMGKTWTGLMSMVSDRWFQFKNLVAEAGLFDVAKRALSGLVDTMDSVMETIGPVFKAGGEEMARLAEEVGLLIGAALALGIIRGLQETWEFAIDAAFGPASPLLKAINLPLKFFENRVNALRDVIRGTLDEINAISADAAARLSAIGTPAAVGAPPVRGGGVSIGEPIAAQPMPFTAAQTSMLAAGRTMQALFDPRLMVVPPQLVADMEGVAVSAAGLAVNMGMSVDAGNAFFAALEEGRSTQEALAAAAATSAGVWDQVALNLSGIANTLSNQIAAGVAGLVTGFTTMVQLMRQLAITIITQVVGALVRAVIQATILKGVMSALGGGVPFLPGFAQGGIVPSAQAGLMVGGVGAVPILAHPGEAVLNRRAVAALGGPSAVQDINRGGGAREISLVVGDIPDPSDYGIAAPPPAIRAWLMDALRRARFQGFE